MYSYFILVLVLVLALVRVLVLVLARFLASALVLVLVRVLVRVLVLARPLSLVCIPIHIMQLICSLWLACSRDSNKLRADICQTDARHPWYGVVLPCSWLPPLGLRLASGS